MNSKPTLRGSANTWTNYMVADGPGVRLQQRKNGCPTLRDFRSVGTTNADIVLSSCFYLQTILGLSLANCRQA
jgi:hypothetical protein